MPSADALGQYLADLPSFAQVRPEYRVELFTCDNYWPKIADENQRCGRTISQFRSRRRLTVSTCW